MSAGLSCPAAASFFKQKHGPVPRAHLQKLAAAGQLKPADMVLQDGSKTWMPAAAIAGLFGRAAPDTVDDSRRTAAYVPPVAAPVAAPLPSVAGYELLGELGRGGM